jgi:hypothetical protein
MDTLVESLIELNELAEGCASENALCLQHDLRAWHGRDSRVPLLADAASLSIPQQLKFGCEPALVRDRLTAERRYSGAATEFAVAAWAAACRLADVVDVPPLAKQLANRWQNFFIKSLATATPTGPHSPELGTNRNRSRGAI